MSSVLVLSRVLASLMGLGLVFGAQAEVFKCADSQGKMTFSDQPCSPGHKGGAVNATPQTAALRQKPATPDSSKGAADRGAGAAEAQQYRTDLLQSMTPECQNLTRRFTDLMEEKDTTNSASSLTPAKLVAELDAKCGAAGRAFAEKRNIPNASVTSHKYQCDTKKSVLDDMRPKFTQLDERAKRSFTAVEQDYNLNCK